jgi:hypothetical protein
MARAIVQVTWTCAARYRRFSTALPRPNLGLECYIYCISSPSALIPLTCLLYDCSAISVGVDDATMVHLWTLSPDLFIAFYYTLHP